MVRAAVRTLTLNVYSIKDPAVQAFVVSKPASNYFNELAIFVAEQCQVHPSSLSSSKMKWLRSLQHMSQGKLFCSMAGTQIS